MRRMHTVVDFHSGLPPKAPNIHRFASGLIVARIGQSCPPDANKLRLISCAFGLLSARSRVQLIAVSRTRCNVWIGS